MKISDFIRFLFILGNIAEGGVGREEEEGAEEGLENHNLCQRS